MSAIDYGPPVRNKARWFWGIKSGYWEQKQPKNQQSFGWAFKQRQFSSGSNNNQAAPKSDAKKLAENAIAMGWYNGRRIGKAAAAAVVMKKKAN